MQQEFITVTFNRSKIAIRHADILYAIMSDDHCTIHMLDGGAYIGCSGKFTVEQDDRKVLFQSFFEYGCKMASWL